MNIGSLFKALVAVAKSDAGTTLLPAIAKAATSVAANQGDANLVANGAFLLAAALPLGPKIEADEILMLADVVSTEATAFAATAKTVTPAQAAAAAIAG